MQKTIIIANWKMNPGSSPEAWNLAEAVKQGVAEAEGAKVVLCPPFVFVAQILPVGNVELGAQDCFWEDPPAGGAFTGEVSPSMLKNLGCTYVILGHSERKSNLGETLEMVNRKVRAVLAAGLTPVVCVGEHIEQDLKEILKDLNESDLARSVFVYEPEWAISTAKNAKADSPEHVKDAIGRIKAIVGNDVPVLYGGSTDSKNIKGFIESGAQGALVGSASLDAGEFVQLVKNAVIG